MNTGNDSPGIDDDAASDTPRPEGGQTLDGKKLLRMLFTLMAVHEHSFRVKDIAPGYLVDQYGHVVGEIQKSLPSDLLGELDNLMPFQHDDPNLSEAQSTAASLIGWLNGVLITAGVVSISAPPQLPQQLVSPPHGRSERPEPSAGQYL